jgi:hypothetical protein
MRLAKLDTGHTLATKAMFAMIKVISRHPVPDVVKTMLRRSHEPGVSGSYARAFGVVGRRSRADGRVRVEDERVRVLNEGPRRGRVEGHG